MLRTLHLEFSETESSASNSDGCWVGISPIAGCPDDQWANFLHIDHVARSASIVYLDANGSELGGQDLLCYDRRLRSTPLHWVPGVSTIRLELEADECPGPTVSGTIRSFIPALGLIPLAWSVWRINKARGVSFPAFVREKLAQLRQLGIRALLSSPAQAVDLREMSDATYSSWLERHLPRYEAMTTKQSNHQSGLQIAFAGCGGAALSAQTVNSLEKLSPYCDLAIYDPAGGSLTDFLESCRQREAWLGIVRDGDRVYPHIVHWLTDALETASGADAVYFDHDYSGSEEECRVDPWFKPDWNREYFRHLDYVSRACLVRSGSCSGEALAECITSGSIRPVLEQSEPGNIRHVPEIAYTFDGAPPSPRLREHPEPNAWPSVTVIVPTRNQLPLLKACVESLFAVTDYENFDLIVVDNQSDDDPTRRYLQEIAERPRVSVMNYDAPFNFSAINNAAVEQATGDTLVFLNNDVELFDGEWLRELVKYATQDDVGCVGAKLLYADGLVQHGGIICGLGDVAGHAHHFFRSDAPGYMYRLALPQEVTAVTAACLCIRREVFDEVAGFDEENLGVAFNDVDLCLRVRDAGFRNIYNPLCQAIHREGQTRPSDFAKGERERFSREVEYMWSTWEGFLQQDPAYNPHLTRVREDFSINPGPI